MLASFHQSADLELNTPLDCCCNCGDQTHVELLDTPLKQTRYFFFFGTELTLNETFPYCKRCKGSAKRIQLGLMLKLIAACLLISALFLGAIFIADSLPNFMKANLFWSSVVVGVVATFGYFYWREHQYEDRRYYQPIQLVEVIGKGNEIYGVHLKVHNPKYRIKLAQANPERVAADALRLS